MSVEYCDGDIRWLSFNDLVDLNRLMIVSFTPDEQYGLKPDHCLGSTQAAPSEYRYYEQCEDMPTLAAVLFYSIAKNHNFHNGNKRTAVAAAIVFLRINGLSFTPSLVEGLIMAEDVVKDEYTRLQIATWIANNTEQCDSADLVSDQMEIVLQIFSEA